MKRRNANDGKRRPVKRTKITDNFLGRLVLLDPTLYQDSEGFKSISFV